MHINLCAGVFKMFQNDTLFFAEEQSEEQVGQGQNVWTSLQIFNDPLHSPEFAKLCGGEKFHANIYCMIAYAMMKKVAEAEEMQFSARKLTESCGFIFPITEHAGELHVALPEHSFDVSAEAFGIIFSLFALWSYKMVLGASDVIFDKELLCHIKTHKEYAVMRDTLRFFHTCLLRQWPIPNSASAPDISQNPGGPGLFFEKGEEENSSGEKSVRQASKDFEIE